MALLLGEAIFNLNSLFENQDANEERRRKEGDEDDEADDDEDEEDDDLKWCQLGFERDHVFCQGISEGWPCLVGEW